MKLSTAIASMAVVLGVILAAGYANGEAPASSAGATQPTAQEKVEAREAQRRAAVEEQQKRKEREERVIGDGRRMRHVVAVDQLDDTAPGGDARQPKLRPKAPYDALRRHEFGLLQGPA